MASSVLDALIHKGTVAKTNVAQFSLRRNLEIDNVNLHIVYPTPIQIEMA